MVNYLAFAHFPFLSFSTLSSVLQFTKISIFVSWKFVFHFFDINLSVQPHTFSFPGSPVLCLSVLLAFFPHISQCHQTSVLLPSQFSLSVYSEFSFSCAVGSQVDICYTTCVIYTHSLCLFSGEGGAAGTLHLSEKLPRWPGVSRSYLTRPVNGIYLCRFA